jgi:4-diphosphocytidyl-2-C-methyl-D-erythritol kinase
LQLAGPDYPAPAKLNLFLHVVGRRADGYHLLQSVFTLIDRCDRIRIAPRADGLIRRVNELAAVPEAEDLAVRAARLLQEASGVRLGADIELEMNIPLGGGLGGGSSDAATVLMALDRAWGTGFGPEALGELAPELGADVPFFLYGRSAWVEGIGDVLREVEIPERWYVVLVPPVAVATREVFAAPELTRDTEPLKMEDFSASPPVAIDSRRAGARRLGNDLQAVVTQRFPQVASHLEWLGRHGDARMTGSGACVFAAYGSREEAQRVLDQLPATMQGFVAKGMAHHPLRLE